MKILYLPLLLLLAGCGQKGPLYLPQEDAPVPVRTEETAVAEETGGEEEIGGEKK